MRNRIHFRRRIADAARLALLAMAAAAALPPQAPALQFHFIQLSDTHQGRAIHQYRYREAIRQINALPFAVDCVVHTGDLVSNGVKSPDVAGAAADFLASIRAPHVVCPGNHDIVFQHSDPTNRFLRTAAAYQNHFGPLAQSHETSNAVYIAICTETLRNGSAPEIPGFAPLDWLEKRLSQTPPDKPVFVCTHVPDCDDYRDGVFSPGWENAKGLAAWRAVLARHPNVKAVLAGHFHRNAYAEHEVGGPPTIVASCFASFWQRQASYRIFTVTDGRISWQDVYIEDPPPDVRLTHDGRIVENPALDAPPPAGPVDTADQVAPPTEPE